MSQPAGQQPAAGGAATGPTVAGGTVDATAADGTTGPLTARGGIPLRPLSTGEILDGTFATIRRNPRTVLGLSAVFVTVQEVVTVLAEALLGRLPAPVLTVRPGSTAELGSTVTGIVGYLLAAVVGAVLTGMVVVVVTEDVLGRRVGMGEVWRRVRGERRLAALVVAAVLAGALPYLGLLLFLVPGVLLWSGWSLATPALVVERLGPVRALRRSWKLALPDLGRVWGIRTLSVLIGLLVRALLVLPFVAAASLLAVLMHAGAEATMPLPALVITVLGSIAAGTVVAPFEAGVLALLYVDRRMRAEGLDIVWQLALARRPTRVRMA
jgi:hypothetical protein